MNLNGNWEGYYEYGEGYILPYFGERVKIEVIIKGENDSFTGSTTEEESNLSVPSEARIKGFTEGDMISFVKTYPINPQIDGYSNKIQIKEGQLDIEHVGFCDHKNQSIYGSWQIQQVFKNEYNQDDVEYVGGIWFLKKVQ
ncbi:hypothetical protein ACSTS3_21270 [Aquimarina muelleri]|uniref:hypothetical protein n=1 Tax=Aquimarina muelleri TaxID=279356 RepID=UPI003F685755